MHIQSNRRLTAGLTRLSLALTAVLTFTPGAHAITLTKDGTPNATIVVAKAALDTPEAPAPPARRARGAKAQVPPVPKALGAARELQAYIQKISGAKLPIVGDDQAPAGNLILVGRSKLADAMGVAIPSGLTAARREEGFVVCAKGDRLLLAGNEEFPYHGTEYAVYDFLERLGVRWFMPTDYGEVVPTTPTITFADTEYRQHPGFVLRSWWAHMRKEAVGPERLFKLHNKMTPEPNLLLAVPGDSSARKLLPEKEYFKDHPELYALKRDGTPNPHLPSFTNPQAIAASAKTIEDHFRANPRANSYGLAPDDGMPRDWSPATLAENQGFPDLGGRPGVDAELSVTEEWFTFVNALAREVHKEFPDRYLVTNGYANRNTPPQGMKIDDHVAVMFAALWCDTMHAYDDPKSWQMQRQGQMLRQWCALCPNVFIYGYDYGMTVSGLTPYPQTHTLARDFRLLKKWGVIGFTSESNNIWMQPGIATRYLRARLLWDPNADAKAILDDFYSKWYGAAAAPAHAFYDAIEDAIDGSVLQGHEDRVLPYVYTPELLATLDKDLGEAQKLADTDRHRQHVEADRLILAHLKAYMAVHQAEWAGNFVEAARQIDVMMEQRKQLSALSPFWCLPDESDRLASGVFYWPMQGIPNSPRMSRQKFYRALADETSGVTGDLVALLPAEARFSIDPHDEGRFAGWYAPAWADTDWQGVSTTRPFYLNGYLDKAGYPYVGSIWYRVKADVPASFQGKPIHLCVPTMETEAWVWVNGQYVGHRPYKEAYIRPAEVDMDITPQVEPGKTNAIAIRVYTSLTASQAADGIMGRMFLYSPKAAAAGAATKP